MASKVPRLPKMYLDMSLNRKKNCLSAGAIPFMGCGTNTIENMDRLTMTNTVAQNVKAIMNLIRLSTDSLSHFICHLSCLQA